MRWMGCVYASMLVCLLYVILIQDTNVNAFQNIPSVKEDEPCTVGLMNNY
jgi:hypothetical protein